VTQEVAKLDLVKRFGAIREKTHAVLDLARQLYGVDIQPHVSFNLRGRAAGIASCRMCRITRRASDFKVRYNPHFIQGEHFQDMLDNTVPHEIAHLVTYMRPDLGRKHDAGWRRICLALGGNGLRCHAYDVPVTNGFTYRASCGTLITVSKVIHNKIQMGQSRRLKKTGGRVDRFSAWAPHGEPVPEIPQVRKIAEVVWPQPRAAATPPVQQPQPRARAVKAASGELTWAEKVRRLIREQKSRGISQETVISLAVMNLGMTRERARSCVKAHWDKVV
jgi:SprT protein